MAKYYVESGAVKLVLQARSARQAAIAAFQWSCDRQATIEAESPLEHVQIAEQRGWQLEEKIAVSERGFGQFDALEFDTLDVVAAWQGAAYPWVACGQTARDVDNPELVSGLVASANPFRPASPPRSTQLVRRAARDRAIG